MNPVLLFADADTLVKLAVALLVGASWLYRLLYGDKKAAPERRPVAPARPVKQPDASDPKVNQEIEEFLKRTAQRRGGKTRRKAPAAAAPAQAEAAAKPRRLVQGPADPAPAPVRTTPLGSSVSEHVQKHLATEEFSVRAAHLADDVVRAEEEMQQHLQKAFSHQVGRLADTSRQGSEDKAAAVAADAKKTEVSAADDLHALMTDGRRLRQAIILKEIFERPEHRW